MLNPDSPLMRLVNAPMRSGVVRWIGLRSGRRAPMSPRDQADLDPVEGVLGDHYRSRCGGSRHVTLIAQAQLYAIASHLGVAAVAPEQLRRNIVVDGLNLMAMKGGRLRLGTALLEITGECHPCSRMEAILGVGGYNAVRGHGGVTARVVAGGVVRIGDAVTRVDAALLASRPDALNQVGEVEGDA